MVTIGIVLVAFMAAWPAGCEFDTITSTGMRASSTAAGKRPSSRPPAERHSIVMVSPGIRPDSLRPAIRTGASQTSQANSPTFGRLAADCARANVGEPRAIAQTMALLVV